MCNFHILYPIKILKIGYFKINKILIRWIFLAFFISATCFSLNIRLCFYPRLKLYSTIEIKQVYVSLIIISYFKNYKNSFDHNIKETKNSKLRRLIYLIVLFIIN